jgi:hypothetical protein
MSLNNVERRLAGLEQRLGSDCPETVVVVKEFDSIDDLPPPESGPDPEPCSKCGFYHVIEILQVVVESRQDVARLDALGWGKKAALP